jgi:hypothetical protein
VIVPQEEAEKERPCLLDTVTLVGTVGAGRAGQLDTSHHVVEEKATQAAETPVAYLSEKATWVRILDAEITKQSPPAW